VFFVPWFGRPMGSPDGEENVHRGRHHRDLRPLVRGRSRSALAASLGVDRKTVRKYLAPSEVTGIIPGGPPMTEGWSPGLVDRRLRQVTRPDIDQHRDEKEDLAGTMTVFTIHPRLRDEHRRKVSISSFPRWAHATLLTK
jgi:DNA-binding transcriptional MocR family regulator